MVTLEKLIDSFIEINGKGTLNQIYKSYYKITGDDSLDIRATIRATIYCNSYDSKVNANYKNKKNIFQKISTKPVVWRIREEYFQEEKSDDPEETDFFEGQFAYRIHKYRERNRTIIKEAKNKFAKEHNGDVFCEICGCNMSLHYGELGKNFVEVHHLKPVSEMESGEKTNIDDLIMVCPNCHRMIHKMKPLPHTLFELKNVYKK